MIPTIELLTHEITDINRPSNTHRIVFTNILVGYGVLPITLGVKADAMDRLNGFVDGLEAVAQTVYLTLSTERYEFIIYSWDYGVELIDLTGKPMPYVMSELPRRITEALTQDDRIKDVVDFEFEPHGKRLHATFTVVSNFGNIPTELEVEV